MALLFFYAKSRRNEIELQKINNEKRKYFEENNDYSRISNNNHFSRHGNANDGSLSLIHI